MSTRRLVISLYKDLLRESEKLSSYNFRMYAQRKIKHSFRVNKLVSDFDLIDQYIQMGKQNLDLIRRQAIIGHLYAAEKLVIEQKKVLRSSEE